MKPIISGVFALALCALFVSGDACAGEKQDVATVYLNAYFVFEDAERAEKAGDRKKAIALYLEANKSFVAIINAADPEKPKVKFTRRIRARLRALGYDFKRHEGGSAPSKKSPNKCMQPTACPSWGGKLNLARPPLSRRLRSLRSLQESRQRLGSREVQPCSRQSVADAGR